MKKIRIPKSPKIQSIGKDEWLLLEEVRYNYNGWVIIVPRGFVFDGASIPRWAWSIMGHPMSHPTLVAALIHDWLYATEYCSRLQADKIFYRIMRKAGVAWWRANTMYYAVRLGGGFVWKAHTKAKIQANRDLLSNTQRAATANTKIF